MLHAATCNFSSLIWTDGSAPAALASLLFFSRTCIFFLLTLSLPWSSFFFSSLLLLLSPLSLSDSSHLCFSSVHIGGSLTSKLSSLVYIYLPIYKSINESTSQYILYLYYIYFTILSYIILCYIIWYDMIWYYTILNYIIFYYILLYFIIFYYIIFYYILLYYNIIYYNYILWYDMIWYYIKL